MTTSANDNLDHGFQQQFSKELVFIVEEPSMENVLNAIVPKIVSDPINFQVLVFEGKQDLEKRFVKRIQFWQNSNARFMIIRDQDNGDCYQIKKRLLTLASDIEKPKLVRIVCHELETFFLGDLLAVDKSGLGKNLTKHQKKRKFRSPDELSNAKEEFKKLCKEYQQISGSRTIAPYLDIENNASVCFNMLVNGIRALVD